MLEMELNVNILQLCFLSLYVPVHESLVLIPSASSKGSGKSAHMRRLARTFGVRIHIAWMKMKVKAKI